MSTDFNNIDDFLNHSGSEQRSQSTFLKGWKAKGYINVWLHTRRLPLGLWQHRFPRLVVRDDRDTGESTKMFYSSPLNCWEDEGVLKKQWHFDDEGRREVPPEACPLCKLLAIVRDRVESGDLSWTDPVFEFSGATDPKNNITLHAGGMYGAFSGKNLNDQQLAELRAAHIRRDEVFKENAVAKLGYVFCVVDHDNPGQGVQVAIETKLLGEKVQKVIRDTRKSLGDEDGNPMVRPFCIELQYDKGAKSFSDMYNAVRIEKLKITPEIEKLIRGEAPDLVTVTEPFNADALRSTLERYAKIKLPWDEIFAGGADEFPPREEERSSTRAIVPPPASSAAMVTNTKTQIPCDGCKAPMDEDAPVCLKCGAKYEITPDEVPPPPPPVKRRGKASGDKIPFDRS